MSAITFKHKGDFSKTSKFFSKVKKLDKNGVLDEYGKAGVAALASATPVDTGKTAASWYYKISSNNRGVKIEYFNSNVQNGVPIAIIIQYGHGTGTGGYVQGRDYINPAIQPIFDDFVDKIWKEVRQ